MKRKSTPDTDKVTRKPVTYTPKSPLNDPPIDPDFPPDYEDDFIESENEEIGGSHIRISHGFTEEQRAQIIAQIKEARKRPCARSNSLFGRKAE